MPTTLDALHTGYLDVSNEDVNVVYLTLNSKYKEEELPSKCFTEVF